MQEILIWPYEQMVYAKYNICPLGFWDTNGSPNLSHRTKSYNKQQKKKKTCKIVNVALPADHRVKLKENEKMDKYLHLSRKLKKLWKTKVTIIPIAIGARGRVTKMINKGTGWFGNKRMSGQHPNYCIFEIIQNTKKSSGNLSTLVVTQTAVKDHQLTLM